MVTICAVVAFLVQNRSAEFVPNKMSAMRDNSKAHQKQVGHRNDSLNPKQSFAYKKKEWRKHKYKQFIGNVKEGQGFADKRKMRVMHEYRKILRKEKQKLQTNSDRIKDTMTKSADEEHPIEEGNPSKMSKKKLKVSAFHKAELEHRRQAKEREKRKQEAERKREARQEAEARYRKKKKARHKALSKKTFLGQPNMSSQIDYLLKRIESQTKS